MILLPSFIDMTPNRKLKPRVGIGEEGYADNVEYQLTITVDTKGIVSVEYYGDDGSELSKEQILKLIS